jgi:hypothetical protein
VLAAALLFRLSQGFATADPAKAFAGVLASAAVAITPANHASELSQETYFPISL